MSILTVVLILAMLLWSVGFMVVGIVLAEEVLWRRPAGKAAPPVLRTRKIGAMGGILIVTEIVAGGSWRNARRTSSTWSPGSATLSTGWARRMLFPRALPQDRADPGRGLPVPEVPTGDWGP